MVRYADWASSRVVLAYGGRPQYAFHLARRHLPGLPEAEAVIDLNSATIWVVEFHRYGRFWEPVEDEISFTRASGLKKLKEWRERCRGYGAPKHRLIAYRRVEPKRRRKS